MGLPTQNPHSSNVSSRTVSREGLLKARAILEDSKPIEIVQLLPVWVCQDMISRYKGPFQAMGEGPAKQATLTLLSGKPYAFKGDEGQKMAYMRRVEQVFALYPEWAAVAVTKAGAIVSALPQFLPSDTEIAAALEAEVSRVRSYAVKAQWHVDEGIRRAKQQELDSACSKLSPEAKAALVSKAFARIKPMSEREAA